MRKIIDIDARPLKGGCVTARDKALLPFGAFSSLRNMRNTHPGLDQRPGQRKAHSLSDGVNQVLTLYQFRKTNTPEKHLYAQMGDGDVLEASDTPPNVIAGVFGSEAFSGSIGQVPASWATLDDLLLFSNGVDQHQIFGGTMSPVEKFIVFKGSAPIPDTPQGGEDYSDQVSDGQPGTVADLGGLSTYANHDCIFFRAPVPCSAIGLTVASPNAKAAAAAVYYWKSDHSWAAVSGLSDDTDVAGATLGRSGSISWTPPSDLMEKYAFGSCGFWYQIRFSAAIDSAVTISQATYAAGFQNIRNVWDGTAQYGVEVQVQGDNQFLVFPAGAVDLDSLAAGKKVYLGFTDPIEGIYADPGATPTASGNSIASLKFWDGNSWESVGTPTDGTDGLSHAGWITFPRQAAQPLQFNTSLYHAYWYEIAWSADMSVDTVVAFQGQPYFDINDLGRGYAVCAWKDRACYVYDRWGAYIYVSAQNRPLVLNGSDYGILKAGDGRANRIVAMRRFYNELMVWQEELGVEGGCITLFEGYSPATFGKIVLSSRIGGMNAKAVAVVDGVLTSTSTDESIKTLAFSLSRYGIAVTDGRTVSMISDDIADYFDPTKPECIRFGYEKEMWLEHDAAFNVIRVGLVSGESATSPNVFPVFDLASKTWSFDTLGQPLSCLANIEPATGGSAPVVQIGGGVADGTVYQLNYGVNDVQGAVDAGFEMVLGHRARMVELSEVILRLAAQRDGGHALLTVKENEREKFTKHLSMEPEAAMNLTRRHRFSCSATSDLLTLSIQNNSVDEVLKIHEIGLEVKLWDPS